jgi:ABC-type transport system involved in cytochrome c biogenesis permease subunit
MATETFQKKADPVIGDMTETDPLSLWSTIRPLLLPLASLKLTVSLFAMSIFIVLAGTFAQVNQDIWVVIHEYFRIQPGELFFAEFPFFDPTAAFVWIKLQVFFPPSLFPNKPVVSYGFPFPKGWLIGSLMAINLVAAHSLRFKIQAKAERLWAGVGIIALGAIATWMVIVSGSSSEGLQGAASIGWSTLWNVFLSGLMVLWGLGLYGLFQLESKQQLQRWGLVLFQIILGGLVGWLLYKGDSAQLGDSSMRILWQLIKATFAGLVLLAGCVMIFRKRAGIVLLHGGIGLMMFSELLVGTQAVEGQMVIQEGETVNYSRDIRTFELAVVDSASDPDYENHTVISKSAFLKSHDKKKDKKIQNEDLPFDIEVVSESFLKNSRVRDLKPGEKTSADSGAGLRLAADAYRPGSGTDMDAGVDIASAYVRFLKKGSDELIGTYLVSIDLKPQQVTVGEKSYDIALRFKRMYKLYSMNLIDVRKVDYKGTSTPRDYSSIVRLVDEERNVDREIRIWMNNPLRFGGETFYQSSYAGPPDYPVETTTLQVVSNTGWMIPYVSCMLVATGLLAHFSIVLVRFLNRRTVDRPAVSPVFADDEDVKHSQSQQLQTTVTGNAGWIMPLVIVLVFAGWLSGKARMPKESAEEFHLQEFAKLPIVHGGRVKPMGTLARSSLRILSGKQMFPDGTKRKYLFFWEKDVTQPAILWLMDLIARPEVAAKHRVIEIHNSEVLQTLGLERRKPSLYSIDELRPKMEEFYKQVNQAREQAKKAPEDQSVYQKKILELDGRIRRFTLLEASFHPRRDMPPMPTREEFENNPAAQEELIRFISVLRQSRSLLDSMEPPLVVPMKPLKAAQSEEADSPEIQWEAYSNAWWRSRVELEILMQDPDPAMVAMANIVVAYKNNDPKKFNQELKKYQEFLAANPPEGVNISKTNFETSFNHFEPFYHASVLYVVSFILAALAWLGWSKGFNRASLWLILFTFGVHTLALIARIYISERPPVTNLYSSAVFIGWGCVLMGMIFEAIYRNGTGNVVSSVSGFSTLLIAHLLTTAVPSFRGDTFTVMIAVLDTQFWLATHVVCITLGYSTTFLAGMLGVFYILRGLCTPSLTPSEGKDLVRMIYGTLCFAIFFSFVGTVLGGLWADDSWGRFWGWDPKENGALIIVLWNALVLHARWGGMVKNRGLAVLAVGGNIVTSWSWFGVNELGVGLHSYGFTEGVMLTLGIFIASQLLIIAAGSMPKHMWWSFRDQQIG